MYMLQLRGCSKSVARNVNISPQEVKRLFTSPASRKDINDNKINTNWLIYCGDPSNLKVVTITRHHLLNVVEERDINEEAVTLCINQLKEEVDNSEELKTNFEILNIQESLCVFENYMTCARAKSRFVGTDIPTKLALWEPLHPIFYRLHVLIPMYHDGFSHYTLLECMQYTKKFKHYNSMRSYPSEKGFDLFSNRAQHMAYQVRHFMDGVRIAGKRQTQGKSSPSRYREIVLGEHEGDEIADTKELTVDERKTWDMIIRRDLKMGLYEYLNWDYPQLATYVTCNSGVFLLYLMEAIVRKQKLSRNAVKKYKVKITEKLRKFQLPSLLFT